MKVLNSALTYIQSHRGTSSAKTLALATASACSSRYGVSLIDVSSLDDELFELVKRLGRITLEDDFSNGDQDYALQTLRNLDYID